MYGVVQAAAIAAALLSHHGHVTVVPGDTLSAIAARPDVCGTASAYPGLAAASHFPDPDKIWPGQQVTIACHGTAPARPRYAGRHRRHHDSSSGTYRGSGAMERCIIARESGGDSQVMNSSGHYGLYQFSEATWVASGGSAADFGHASAAEQQRVFRNAVAARGYSDWTPYDGC